MKTNINQLLKANPVNCAYGAPMGDPGYIKVDQPLNGLCCQRVRMVDHTYGPDGTYWGGPGPTGHIYAVFNAGNDEWQPACGLLKYFRAHGRSDAIRQFLARHPGYSFIVGG